MAPEIISAGVTQVAVQWTASDRATGGGSVGIFIDGTCINTRPRLSGFYFCFSPCAL